MIVLEGADVVGKSSVSAELFKLIPEEYTRPVMPRHYTKPPNCHDKYWGYRSCVERYVIMDRFHMSHVVYRAVDGELNHLTPFRYSLVDAEVTRVGGLIVILWASEAAIRERWDQSRGEMYDLDFVLKCNRYFKMIADCEGAKAHYSPFKGYSMKADLTIKSNTASPREIADVVARAWAARQDQLDRVLAVRPGTLD